MEHDSTTEPARIDDQGERPWVAGVVIKRLSRQERREQTRERLLDAAAQVFGRQGFGSATLDQVAEAAGYTKGAVYSNFQSKNDLFIALIDRRIREQTDEASVRFAGMSLQDAFRAMAAAGEPDVTADTDWMALACEFWLYARRDERARTALAEQYERARMLVAGMLAAMYAEAGLEPSMPPRDLAILNEALGIGILFQHAIDPVGVPMSLLNRAMLRLHGQTAASLARPAGPEQAARGDDAVRPPEAAGTR